MVYGALVVVPMWLPVYGSRLPNWAWFGIPVQVGALLTLAAYADHRRSRMAYPWLLSAMAYTGAVVFFSVGAYILITRSITLGEQLGLTAFGLFCLVFLTGIDRLGWLWHDSAPEPGGLR